MTTVAIIGAGIGGVYLVAEMGLAGHRLRLHDLDDTRLADIRARGGVDVEPGGLAAIEYATTDLAQAVDGAEIIIVVTGGNAQEAVARSLAPLLCDGQIILLIQGNTGGALVVRRALGVAGCRADVDVAEMDNYPFSNWRLSPTRIRPIVKKRWLQIASFPGNRIASVFSRLEPLVSPCCGRTECDPHRLHQRERDAACGELHRQCWQDRSRRDLQVLRRGCDAVGRSALPGDQRRTRCGGCGARLLGADAGGLVRSRLRRARRGPGGELSVAHHQQRRPVSGDGDTEVVRPQIHHRGRAGRADPDERARCRGRRADADDRCAGHDWRRR